MVLNSNFLNSSYFNYYFCCKIESYIKSKTFVDPFLKKLYILIFNVNSILNFKRNYI